MKKITVLLLLYSLFFTSSCQESRVSSSSFSAEQLTGKWSIVHVLAGFSSFIQEYPRNTIEWDFDTTAHTVSIQNNSTNAADRYIFENGTYPYVITPNYSGGEGCLQTIKVHDVDLGCCTITNGELSFSALYLDGDYVKLVR
jgi:hypothetical protein